MSIELKIDAASFDNFQRQMDILKVEGEKSFFRALCKVAMKIQSSAKLRLKGQSHVKTSRLINSIYLQGNKQSEVDLIATNNSASYSADGKTYSARMTSVGLTDKEVAVGTNVEYAGAMESGARPHEIRAKNKRALAFMMGGVQVVRRSVWHPGYKGDSYLQWAIQNVDIKQSLAQDMRDEFKFGAGVKAQQTSKAK